MTTFDYRSAAWLLLLLFFGATRMRAQDDSEFDTYTLRISGAWFHSSPSGSIQDSNKTNTIDLQKDLGFNNYSSFVGELDWKFTHKNHLYLKGASFDQSSQHVLTRTIVFQKQTFDAGLSVHPNLSAPLIAPGYQYDIIRRKRGHLGLGAQIDLFNSSASINAAAQVTSDGVHHDAVSAKASLLVPIPVAGPEFRLYLTNSPRLFVEGNVYGMYLFGYGNFVSTADDIGFTITRHLSVNAGYALGSRLIVHNSVKNDRIGVHLTQQGPVLGLQVSF